MEGPPQTCERPFRGKGALLVSIGQPVLFQLGRRGISEGRDLAGPRSRRFQGRGRRRAGRGGTGTALASDPVRCILLRAGGAVEPAGDLRSGTAQNAAPPGGYPRPRLAAVPETATGGTWRSDRLRGGVPPDARE